MKKTALVLLVIVLALQFAPATGSALTTAREQAFGILEELGIMSVGSEPNTSMTRGEFIHVVISLMGIDGVQGSQQVFVDCSSDYPFYESIQTANAIGLVGGFGDGTIRAEESITYSQAVKVLVYALGYGPMVNAGMSMASAITDAQITAGVSISNNDGLTRGESAQLIINTANANVLEASGISSEVTYSNKSGDTLLSKHRKIYKIEGIITGNENLYIAKPGSAPENFVEIGGELYRVGFTEAKELLGYNVTAYYKDDEVTGNKELRYVYIKTGEAFVITHEEITSYSGRTIEYYDKSGNNKKAAINMNVDFIFNNAILTSSAPEDIIPKNGTMTLIDNNGDGDIDVIIVRDYIDCIVESVDVSNRIIYFMFGREPLHLDDAASITFVDKNGNKMDIIELAQWDVLSIVKSDGGKMLDMIYVPDEVYGSVTSVGVGDDRRIEINEKGYTLSKYYGESAQRELRIGDMAMFYLNAFGEIIGANFESRKDKFFAYIISSIAQGALGDDVAVKYLGPSGGFEYSHYSNMLQLDGKFINNFNKSRYDEQTILHKPQLVVMGLDDNGRINYIDTSQNSSEESRDTLDKYYSGYTLDSNGVAVSGGVLKYKSIPGILGALIGTDANTVVMIIPADGSNATEKDYAVNSRSYLRNDSDYAIDAYKTTEDSHFAEALVIYARTRAQTLDADTPITVVDMITTALNADGGTISKLYAYTGGVFEQINFRDNEVLDEITVDGSKYVPQRGDVVRYNTDNNGDINIIELIYAARYQNGYLNVSNPSTASTHAIFRVQLANVYKKYKSSLLITRNALVEGTEYNYSITDLEHINGTIYKTVTYDSKENKLYVSGAEDAIGFVNTGGATYSKILVQDRYGDPRNMVIYK